jgi:hypothetical protein
MAGSGSWRVVERQVEQMSIDRVLGGLSILVFLPFAFRYFRIWFYELRFYRERKWDFSIDSKYSGSAKWGDAAPNDDGTPISNRTRVQIFMPFMAFGSFFATFLGLFFLIRG